MRPSEQHLGGASSAATLISKATPTGVIPDTVSAPLVPPPPRDGPKLETYSVVVSQVEIGELLFAMARDARINVDVHPEVKGTVTVNAIEQTLPQILSRLSRQVDLRYEFDGDNLVVLPNKPFLRHYAVDYVNISRTSTSNTSIATQISSAGGGALNAGSSSQANNNSVAQIVNTSNNHFWETLIENLNALVLDASGQESNGGGDSAQSDSSESSDEQQEQSRSSSSSRAPIVANREAGLVMVLATQRQHERVREYIDRVMNASRRQVLIEATIAEVQLSDEYQQGVNWSKLRLDGSGWSLFQQPEGTTSLLGGSTPGTGPGGITFPPGTGGTNLPGGANAGSAASQSMGVIRYLRSNSKGNLGFALSLLQSFGKVKVLSSPKISVLNNQTAVLKVVDNRIYFTIDVQVTPGNDTSAPLITYSSKPNTVPVGFVMNVTPQIKDTGEVMMNVRPTISRIIGFVNDPNPALAQNNVVSRIPEIQTREIESIISVASGDIAVMGGLMQEAIDDRTDAIPGAGHLPVFGEFFRYRNDNTRKSELVIFLRPTVVKNASLDGDYKGFKRLQPDASFFNDGKKLPYPRSWLRQSNKKTKDTSSSSAPAQAAAIR